MTRTANRRIYILIGISLLAALGIAVRFAFIMLGPPALPPQAPRPVRAERGPILDKNGRLLAIQTRLYSVTAWRPHLEDLEKTSLLLGEALEMDPQEIYNLLGASRSSRFLFVRRKATPTQSERVRALIEKGEIPGIGLQEELGRHYPEKELAAPVLGYVGTDNTGLDGIEYAFDRILAPSKMSSNEERSYGYQVYLTLDLNAQYIVEQIAQAAWEEHDPDALMVLVMDAQSGEFLSWVSLPSFDPNNFTEYPAASRTNQPLISAYEPGSVFKIYSWASFFELGGVHENSRFPTTGGYEPEVFKKYKIPPITDIGNYGVLNPLGVLIHSSNVGTSHASDTVGSSEFYNMLRKFGFGAPTGLPLPGESYGILDSPQQWSVRTKPTLAFGQEIGVSAVQMISAATVLANGGVLLRPRIVSKVVAPDGTVVKEYPREPLREVISPKTAKTLMNMMEQAVASPEGTVRRARVPGLRISAKSGTAQIADSQTGTYSEDRFLSSVLAIFPTEDPQLIVYVILENPKGFSYYGGRIASPVVKEIATVLGPYYGIPLAENQVVTHSGTVPVQNAPGEPLGKVLPDMTGYSKRMLLPYLSRDDIQWTLEGEGWVVFQFPPPGTPLEEGMKVYLELR